MNLVLEFFQKTLLRVGKAMARPDSISRAKNAQRQHAFNLMIGLVLAVLFFVGFSVPIANYFQSTYNASPNFLVGKDRWKVFYGEECGQGCEKLWRSSSRLSDQDFYSEVRMLHGKKFWVGFELDAAEQAVVAESGANNLVIGRINAGFRGIVNGDVRITGDGSDGLISAITLAQQDFSGRVPMRFWLEVSHNLNSVYPIAINEPSADAGFYDSARVIDYRDRKIFLTTIRPVALGTAALLAALIFFLLWLNVRDRNEYFIFGLFCLCLFGNQMLNWTSVAFLLSRDNFYLMDLVFRVAEGVLIGSLGLSYSRSRIGAYVGLMGLGVMAFLTMHRAALLGSDLYFASGYVANFFTPMCFLLGIAACFSQATVGKAEGFSGMSVEKTIQRRTRLYHFGFLLLSLGVIYLVNALKLFHLGNSAIYWYRPIQFVSVGFVAAFLLRDFRDFDVLQQKSYTSKFHSPTALSQKPVFGFLLEVDMKESSALYNFSAEQGYFRDIPSLWNEAVVEISASRGGAVLSTEGDAFRAFFEQQTSLSQIFCALGEIEEFGQKMDSHGYPIHFRATLVKGGILPVYKEIRGKLFEDYNHAPGETCFKDASRFLKEEKKARLSGSILVVEDSLLREAELPIWLKKLKTEKLSVADVGQRELSFLQVSSGESAANSVA